MELSSRLCGEYIPLSNKSVSEIEMNWELMEVVFQGVRFVSYLGYGCANLRIPPKRSLFSQHQFALSCMLRCCLLGSVIQVLFSLGFTSEESEV